MKSTFRILFYAKWEASDEAKMLPIYVRITINGTKARFSLNGGDSFFCISILSPKHINITKVPGDGRAHYGFNILYQRSILSVT